MKGYQIKTLLSPQLHIISPNDHASGQNSNIHYHLSILRITSCGQRFLAPVNLDERGNDGYDETHYFTQIA